MFRINLTAGLDFGLCDPFAKLRLVPQFGIVTEQETRSARSDVIPHRPHHHKRYDVMASFSLTDMQQVNCTITAVDKKGNPTALPAGTVTWTVDSPSVVAITPSADGSSCLLVAGGLGTATVSVRVADTSDVTLAAGSIDIQVTAGAAASINIVPGVPADQP